MTEHVEVRIFGRADRAYRHGVFDEVEFKWDPKSLTPERALDELGEEVPIAPLVASIHYDNKETLYYDFGTKEYIILGEAMLLLLENV